MHLKKSYNYSRPKINFTMEDLEHSEDEDDSYETNVGIPGTFQRLQPSRNCKANQNLVHDQSNETNSDNPDNPSECSDESLDKSQFDKHVSNAVETVLPIDDNENGQETSDGNIQNPPVAKYKDFCDDCYKLFKIYDRKAIRAHLTKFHGYQYAPDPDLDEVPPRPQNEFRSCCRKIFSSQVELDEHILKCPKC